MSLLKCSLSWGLLNLKVGVARSFSTENGFENKWMALTYSKGWSLAVWPVLMRSFKIASLTVLSLHKSSSFKLEIPWHFWHNWIALKRTSREILNYQTIVLGPRNQVFPIWNNNAHQVSAPKKISFQNGKNKNKNFEPLEWTSINPNLSNELATFVNTFQIFNSHILRQKKYQKKKYKYQKKNSNLNFYILLGPIWRYFSFGQ